LDGRQASPVLPSVSQAPGQWQPASGIRSAWTSIDRRYENLRISMQDLFTELGISYAAA
jgi:hypothetical protein